VTGQVVVVTGAASGIGEELAVQLARDWTIVAADLPARLPELGRLADAHALHVVAADVSDPEQVEDLFATACRLGPLAGSVNCAGVTRVAHLTETSPELYDSLMAVNLKGNFLMLRAAALALRREQTPGSIVAITSINAVAGLPDQAVYTAAKAAVNSLVTAAAVECGPYGIRVNAIAPGSTRTAGMNPRAGDDPAAVMTIPMRRIGYPRDIVGPTRFLLSEESAYVTGSVLTVDGGLMHVRGTYRPRPVDRSRAGAGRG
jgi:NAD(P)-dependent dehydrogenase (short-subunit alcohol dehydrogenase family)